jgi:hypothetical protein
MLKMLHDSYSKSSSSSVSNSLDSSINSDSQSSTGVSDSDVSESSKNGSTEIDNKPKAPKQKDGITIHIPQSDLDELSKAASELADYSWPEYSYDVPTFESRSDLEYSTPDDWKQPYDGGVNSGKYPWEDDANIPKFNFDNP